MMVVESVGEVLGGVQWGKCERCVGRDGYWKYLMLGQDGAVGEEKETKSTWSCLLSSDMF